MMTEQQMFEGNRCPVRQQMITPRDEWVKQHMTDRENRLRAQHYDRLARESAYVDAHEAGLNIS